MRGAWFALLAPAFVIVFSSIATAASPAAEQPLAELIEALRNANPGLRAEAADELGRRRDPRALVPLILLLRDPDPTVRAHGAEALRALGDERAAPFLARALDDPDGTVRCRVVLALGDVGGKYVIPGLTRKLADRALVVRAAAVRALGEIGDPLSLAPILKACREEKRDEDDAVGSATLVAAAKIGGEEGLDQAFALAEKRLPASWFLRACAASACGIAGAKARIPLLTRYLRADDDPRVSQAAAIALAMLGAEDVLIEAAKHEEPFRRRAAISGLERIPGEKARAALMDATRDLVPGVVLEAAAALVSRGEAQALPLLIELLEEETPLWLGALQVLELRTGVLLGRNPPAWREWYKGYKEHLTWDAEAGVYRGTK
jgi:HEAT repeat protein